MDSIIQADKELFLALNNLGTPNFDQFWIMVSGTFVWIPLYVIFLFLLAKSYSVRNVIFIVIFIALGVTVSDQLAGLFKTGIARLRPCHDPSLIGLMRIVKCGGNYGFYSSHASNTFFIATLMSILLRKKNLVLPYIVFLWASAVSYSRIYLGVHFPLDIAMGAAVGILLGGFFSTLSLKVINRQRLT